MVLWSNKICGCPAGVRRALKLYWGGIIEDNHAQLGSDSGPILNQVHMAGDRVEFLLGCDGQAADDDDG